MDNPPRLQHLSLCTGYGGIDLGLTRIFRELETVAYVEINPFAVFNLIKKIEAGELLEGPVYTDLKTFSWQAFSGKVDLLSGGFPCQPFSAGSGKPKGDADSRHLWPYIREGIRLLKPAVVFLENVEGILKAKLKGDHWTDPAGTPVGLHILRELERLGYSAEAGIFSAAEVGAPHQRRRVFFLALSDSIGDRARGWLADQIRRPLEGCRQSLQGERQQQTTLIRAASIGSVWPAKRGQKKHKWEPPQTIKPSVGRDFNGAPNRLV